MDNGDFNMINNSRIRLLIVVPCINYPSPSKVPCPPKAPCPPKGPLPINFSLSPLQAWSVIDSKELFRGGFVLAKVKIEHLDLALQVPDQDLALFMSIAARELLGRIPPLKSWAFRENEIVILTGSSMPAALPAMHWEEDLGRRADGLEGVILQVNNLVCDVAFKEERQLVDVRSVAYRHLVKKVVVGQTARLAPTVHNLKEIQWIQRGDVSTIKERKLELANSEGLITSVFMHPLHRPSITSLTSHSLQRPFLLATFYIRLMVTVQASQLTQQLAISAMFLLLNAIMGKFWKRTVKVFELFHLHQQKWSGPWVIKGFPLGA
ncbi:hypothetical protein BT96DRAFT_986908 [Gymnopus androsaceus JB14]|uniref:Uncharacterized protein n=1 Tax=Gymnopus androsaceus JB14 TaxID=1447944 RepID=A0A6A4IAC0_9AGAR|nr:hypothetical protein BT96DRAFT_986908 [Gymnopus androsaceus JB14]